MIELLIVAAVTGMLVVAALVRVAFKQRGTSLVVTHRRDSGEGSVHMAFIGLV